MLATSDYFAALVSEMRIERLFVDFGLLWPPVLAAAITAFKWRRLSSKSAFFVFGVLASFGTHVLLSEAASYIFWQHFARMPARDYMRALKFTDPKVITVIAVGLSIPLVLWLAAILSRPFTPNNGSNKH